jgi:hypothetical protein
MRSSSLYPTVIPRDWTSPASAASKSSGRSLPTCFANSVNASPSVKGECESECKNTADSNTKGGKNWGLARSGNEPGDKTPKLKTGPEMKLTGQESRSGESAIETIRARDEEQTAVRQYRQQVKKYEHLAKSALESQPIRPQAAETDAVLSVPGGD